MARLNHFRVVAGILRDRQGRVLLAERLGDSPFNGYWEFPGGKIGEDESPADALRRELGEELGILAISMQPFMAVQHDYPDRSVDLEFYLVSDWSGQPAGMEGQGIRWIATAEIDRGSMLPANIPVVDALQQILS